MKKIFHYCACLMVLGLGLIVTTACEDDRDSNPTLVLPTTFHLNDPIFKNVLTSLEHTDADSPLKFTWSQPEVGFPVLMNYLLEFSTNGQFAYTQGNAPDGTDADLFSSGTVYATPEASITATTLNSLLQILGEWESQDDAPEEMTLYARVKAFVPHALATETSDTITSNVISFKVAPYFANTKEAEPEIWYIVGDFANADYNWKNGGTENIGAGLLPLQASTSESYDKMTGKGIISYTGYFVATRAFKLIRVPGEWGDQWGSADGGTTGVKNDGGSQNLFVPADGYYTIQLNTATDELSITAADINPEVYPQMLISGDFNGWATDVLMTPATTFDESKCHDWYFDIDATSGMTTAKFLTDSSWSVNWGDTEFPYGKGSQNGPNIPVSEGKWRVFFNDITGIYYFHAIQ